jgi:hypothetical protein
MITIPHLTVKAAKPTKRINMYKDGVLKFENVSKEVAAFKIGCSICHISTLILSGKTTKVGWSVKNYEQ